MKEWSSVEKQYKFSFCSCEPPFKIIKRWKTKGWGNRRDTLTHTNTWAVPGHVSAAVYRWRTAGKKGRKEEETLTEKTEDQRNKILQPHESKSHRKQLPKYLPLTLITGLWRTNEKTETNKWMRGVESMLTGTWIQGSAFRLYRDTQKMGKTHQTD